MAMQLGSRSTLLYRNLINQGDMPVQYNRAYSCLVLLWWWTLLFFFFFVVVVFWSFLERIEDGAEQDIFLKIFEKNGEKKQDFGSQIRFLPPFTLVSKQFYIRLVAVFEWHLLIGFVALFIKILRRRQPTCSLDNII